MILAFLSFSDFNCAIIADFCANITYFTRFSCVFKKEVEAVPDTTSTFAILFFYAQSHAHPRPQAASSVRRPPADHSEANSSTLAESIPASVNVDVTTLLRRGAVRQGHTADHIGVAGPFACEADAGRVPRDGLQCQDAGVIHAPGHGVVLSTVFAGTEHIELGVRTGAQRQGSKQGAQVDLIRQRDDPDCQPLRL